MARLIDEAKKVMEDGMLRIRRRLAGPAHFRQGEDVTFKVGGFASAPSRPMFAARTYYEVKYLRDIFTMLSDRGVPAGRVLEVGCGFGRLSPYIAEHFEAHHAIDINADALALGADAYPHLDFRAGSAVEIPFPDDHFDCVVTWTVLQHVKPHRIAAALAEINRVARSGAALVLCEAHRGSTEVNPKAHTHNRTVEFYGDAFARRPLLDSRDIVELDRLQRMSTPGHIMVFGPIG